MKYSQFCNNQRFSGFIFLICTSFLLHDAIAFKSEEYMDESKTLQIDHHKHPTRQFGMIKSSHNITGNSTVCYEEKCVTLAGIMLDRMNFTEEPCKGFYKYTCGTFLSSRDVAQHYNVHNTETIIQHSMMYRLGKFMAEPIKRSDSASKKLVKEFYVSCMSGEEERFEKNFKYLMTLLNIKDIWPVLTGASWSTRTYSWTKLNLENLQKGFDTSYLIDIFTTADYQRSPNPMIYISQGTFGIPREYLIEGPGNDRVIAYKKLMFNVAKLLGAVEYDMNKEIPDIIEFEIALARASLTKRELEITPHHMQEIKIADFNTDIHYENWLRYINLFTEPRKKLTKEDSVYIINMNYFKTLNTMLKLKSRRYIGNYIGWRTILQVLPYLPHRFRSLHKQLTIYLKQTLQTPPQWEYCVEKTTHSLPIAVGALYVKETNSSSLQTTHIKQMIYYMINVLKKYVTEEYSWIDPAIRKVALSKIHAIRYNVDIPYEFTNERLVEEYYKHLKTEFKTDLAVALEAFKLKRKSHFIGVTRAFNRTYYHDQNSILFSQPSYNYIDNTFDIPFRWLNTTYFHETHPDFSNYAAIGSVIGKQLVKSINDIGGYFKPNSKKPEWWFNRPTLENYQSRNSCFIHQYSRMSVNGRTTVRENIADTIGVKIAYLAYREWSIKNFTATTRVLSGFKDTNEFQLFWIAYTSMYCSKCIGNLCDYGLQAPPKYRALGPLLNIEEFRRDFQCELGTPMHPRSRCNI